jgi:hypothetical protein
MARGGGENIRPRGATGQRSRRDACRWLYHGRSLTIAIICAVVASGAAAAQLSGRFGIDFVARRIPTTLTGEIALDTPSEFAMLEFAIASDLDINVDTSFGEIDLDLAANMAGPEHAVGVADFAIAPIDLGESTLEDIHAIGEMWFAVPFEGVTDVNGLPNCAVIPPGDPLFVSARFTGSFECDGFEGSCLFMLEDVTFPSPSAHFLPSTHVDGVPDYYKAEDQDFGLGSIWALSWHSPSGSSASLTAGINASGGSKTIKGYSDSGRVDSGVCSPEWGNCFLNGSVGGLPLCDVSLGIGLLTDVTAGLAFSVSTTQTLSATLSISGMIGGKYSTGTSITLLTNPKVASGLNISGSVGCFDVGASLDKLEITSLSAGCNTPIQLGAITGSFGIGASGLIDGLTGLSMRLALGQGLFSASTSVAFAQRGDDFGFASLGTQLSFRFSPGTISVQATFGRFGLTRASLSTGVTF